MDVHHYYKTLGISEDATLLEIKRSYRLLVKKYHPDKNSGVHVDSDMIKKINIAYEVLSDNNKRREYDDLCKEIGNLEIDLLEEKDTSLRNYNGHKRIITPTPTRKIIKEISRFKIIVEPSLCMAFGSCEILAPKVFRVQTHKMFNPKAVVISETGNKFQSILDAAQTCPTKAITIIDRYTGKQIFP